MEPLHSDDDNAMEGSSPYLQGINGEAQMLPRVGDQYQAVIPHLIPEDDRSKLITCFGLDPHLVTFGLPIPLMWTRSEKFRGFREAETEGEEEEEEERQRPYVSARTKPRSIVLALPCQKNAKLKFEWLDKSLYPFPGTLGESWEDAERERFLLGLYFLGKNLVLLQRFVGSKKMGDMLSYYYGSFYRSSEYKRWVDGRKSGKSKRSVQGHKLLTGWRQQELLSRVSSHVSEECKSTLVQVYKAFREDRVELEEYVFSLKKLIGLDVLTEAIGIGRGKKDLTLEASKLNNLGGASKVRIRNDLPVADIVKFLTGEYRMSKTRSSDLFWEAVWPRLLARGWHSEQPKDGPKNSLVFLIPEANKFSRRKMLKGNHYFDSLTDVLNRVALDPTLLDLSTDEGIGSKKEEGIKNEPGIDIEEFDDDSSQNNSKKEEKKKKKRYLEPRVKTSKSQEVTMLTIVDTSGVEEGCALKELRSLPIETGNSSYLSESEGYQLSEESENKAETTTASRVCGGGSISSCKSSSVNMDNSSTISLNERLQKNRKRGRPRNPPNRSSLADYSEKPVKKGTEMRPNPSEADQNVVLMREEHMDQDQTLKLSSTVSSAEDSSCGRNEGRQGRHEIREDFDLNVSQISPEAEEAVGVHNSENSCAQKQSYNQMDEEMPGELQVSGPGRRQSTRTRPLTAKALEAFAFGYLGNSEKKRKSTTDESRRRKYTKRIRKEQQALNQEESSS